MAINIEKQLLTDIIKERRIRTVFQPIVDIKNTKIIGYEALSRGPEGSIFERPDFMFDMAIKYDLLWDLELVCRELAIERAHEKELDKLLFINVDPRIINDLKFRQGFTSKIIKSFNFDPGQIIFEITERTAIEDYRAFKEAIDHYVNQGYKIAIDDTGAGYSGMRLITETKPQFIKLDMGLVRDIDKDSFKQAVCKNLLSLSQITNMKLIAEGVETINELNALINIGVEFIQGFYVGRPHADLKDIENDIKEHIYRFIEDKNKEAFYSAKTFAVGKIARIDTPITLSHIGNDVKQIFNTKKVQGIAVINNYHPIGLIMKSNFNSLLATTYGNAIYLNRGVELVMDNKPLIVDYDMPVAEVSQLAMSRSEENLYDYIIVTKDNNYYGIVTVKRLLEYTTELELNYARHLNPLTGLPGNIVIEDKLEQLISQNKDSAIFYIDLDNFKAYNDIYGFENGDKILKMTSELIVETTFKYFDKSAFIGHIGGDDFIIVTDNRKDNIIEFCNSFIKEFDNVVTGFYSLEHLQDGFIVSNDREGNLKKFNIMSISISVISGEGRNFITPHTLAGCSTKIKKECKKRDYSNYIIAHVNSEKALIHEAGNN